MGAFLRIGLCQFIVIEPPQQRTEPCATSRLIWELIGAQAWSATPTSLTKAVTERTLMRGFNTVRNIGRLQKIAGEPALPVARRHAPGGSPVAAEKTRVK